MVRLEEERYERVSSCATAAAKGQGYRVMRRLGPNQILVLLR